MNKESLYRCFNKNIYEIIEFFLIFIYLLLICLSIDFLIGKIILGVICVLFLPGYNLIKLLKPNSDIIERIGYSTILSLAIANLFMLFTYVFINDFVTSPNSRAFYFNETLLILALQIISIALIIANILIRYKKSEKLDKIERKHVAINFQMIREKINKKIVLICISLFLSIILLCIIAAFSNIPKKGFNENYLDYRLNFTFFYRSPFIFYIFLGTAVISMVFLMFSSKNPLIILTCMAAFFYSLWIIPYLQIGNFFSLDSNLLDRILSNYPNYGILAESGYSFIIFDKSLTNFRYLTSIFSGLLIMFATGVNVDGALWFLFPLPYVSIPFFLFSVFRKFSFKKKDNNLFLIMLTLLAMSCTQFTKTPHTASTGVFGIFLYFILIVEFHSLISVKTFQEKRSPLFLIIFLYTFLCFSHFEEMIYFLLIIMIYTPYRIFSEIKKTESSTSNKKKYIKRELLIIGILLIILCLILYLSQEFFDMFLAHFSTGISLLPFYPLLVDLYYKTQFFPLPFLNNSLSPSFFIIGCIVIAVLVYIYACYALLLKYNQFILKVYGLLIEKLKKIYNALISRLLLKKSVQFLIVFMLFSSLLLLNLVLLPFLEETGIFMIIELILSYSLIIFNIFLFIKGMIYYKIENDKQNFFLICLFASSLIMLALFGIRNLTLGFYILNSRFFSYFFFFNLIIIQDNYFPELMKKKNIYLKLFLISLLFLVSFYSLRKLAWG